ncbi:MAG TPA: cytochrome c oxidase assembly factor Coa1 family protein [Pyrinomonadaceae bacterium]|jgi:hypothetical protein
MTTKKLVILIASIIGGIILLVALFVGAIVGIVFYSIGHSEAAETAKNYLRSNQKLKEDIGEVKDFGSIVSGSVNVQNSDGHATLHLKVIGEERKVNASVELMYRNGREWRVTDASYVNEAGETVDLMNKYGPAPPGQ